jgi:mannose-6-phosphate isomerase
MKELIEIKPWGKFEILSEGKNFKVKTITVSPGQRLSYQFHNKRTENWTIVEGNGIFTLNDNEFKVGKGNIVIIQPLEKHRIENTSKTKDLVFIEVQFGKSPSEDDIVRIEDDYGRK